MNYSLLHILLLHENTNWIYFTHNPPTLREAVSRQQEVLAYCFCQNRGIPQIRLGNKQTQ